MFDLISRLKAKYLAIVMPIVLIVYIAFLASCMRPAEYYNVVFDNDLCFEPYSDYTYRTNKDFIVFVDDEEYIIPKHFETDLASIPRWYWAVLSPQYSAFVIPSVIHDYFYRCANSKDRKFADSVFYYALLANDVSQYNATKFYFAVRTFGAHSYSKTLECEPVA